MSTELKESRTATLAYAAGTVAFLIGAIALFVNGHPIFGALVSLMALGLGFAAWMVREANCPSCQVSMGWIIEDIPRCPACRRYSRREGERLEPIKPGFVADRPTFTTSTERLFKARFDPKDWRFPASGCCICGGPAAKTEDVEARFEIDRFLNMATINVYKFKLPHCADHQSGVTFEFNEFKFRSHDYWQTFEKLNGVAQDAGGGKS